MAFDSQELWRGWKFHEQQVMISFILNIDNFFMGPNDEYRVWKGFSFQPLVTNVSKTRHPSCLRLSSKELVWGLSGQRMSLQSTLSKNIVGKKTFFTHYPTTRLWSSWDKSIRQLLVSKPHLDAQASPTKVSIDSTRTNEGRVDRLHCAHAHQGAQGNAGWARSWLWWWLFGTMGINCK